MNILMIIIGLILVLIGLSDFFWSWLEKELFKKYKETIEEVEEE